MKYKFLGGGALLLSAAMVLSGCGGSTVSADTDTLAESGIQVVSAVPAAVSADTAGVETAFAEAFSSRDLAGTYDAASAVRIALNGTSISCDSSAVTVSGTTVTITAAGTYLFSGTLDNGTVIVDAGKEDKVQLVLEGVSIHSDTFAAIYVRQADKVFVTLAEGTVNTLSNGGTFTAIDDYNVDGVIFSKDDLTLNGSGKLVISASGKHGVVCKDDLVITDGTYEITASSHALSGKDSVSIAGGTFTLTAGKDGIHSENTEDAQKGSVYLADGTFTITAGSDGVSASGILQVDGGTYTITASEGMEGTYLRVNGGTVQIYATDDGMNAARKVSGYTPTIEINGGDLKVEVGPGDTDGIDSNGNLIITGGTIDVTGNSAFDCDGTVTFTGGTVIVNGQQVDTIPTQMGGRGGMGGMGRNFNGGGMPEDGTLPGSRSGRTPDGTIDGTPDGMMPNGRGGKGQKPGKNFQQRPDAVTNPTENAGENMGTI